MKESLREQQQKYDARIKGEEEKEKE